PGVTAFSPENESGSARTSAAPAYRAWRRSDSAWISGSSGTNAESTDPPPNARTAGGRPWTKGSRARCRSRTYAPPDRPPLTTARGAHVSFAPGAGGAGIQRRAVGLLGLCRDPVRGHAARLDGG